MTTESHLGVHQNIIEEVISKYFKIQKVSNQLKNNDIHYHKELTNKLTEVLQCFLSTNDNLFVEYQKYDQERITIIVDALNSISIDIKNEDSGTIWGMLENRIIQKENNKK